MRGRGYLLKSEAPEQPGLTLCKSTSDRIPAPRVLVESRRESWEDVLAALVDLKKTFNSVHWEGILRPSEATWDASEDH